MSTWAAITSWIRQASPAAMADEGTGAIQAVDEGTGAIQAAASSAAAARSEGKVRPPEEMPLDISAVRKMFREYPVDGIDPEKVRWIERCADLGDVRLLMQLFDDVVKDSHVAAELAKLKVAVAGAPVVIEPGEDSDRGRVIATAASSFVRAIPHWRQLCVDLLDAEFRGFAATQLAWVARKGRWWVDRHEPIESRFFRFTGDTPLVETEAAPMGEPLPPSVLFHCCRDKAGPVARGGIGRSILRPWLYKGFALVDGMSYLERFGHPHVWAEIPRDIREGSPLMDRCKDAIRALVVDNASLVPAGVTLHTLEAVNKAATVKDVYLAFVEWCELAISKAILGQTLTTQAGPRGSQALGRVHREVSQELTELRAARLADTLNRQLLRPWTLYHYGAEAPVPELRFATEPPADERERNEAESLRAKTLETAAFGLRVAIPVSFVRKELRLPEPTAGELTIGGTDGENYSQGKTS